MFYNKDKDILNTKKTYVLENKSKSISQINVTQIIISTEKIELKV